MIDNATFMKAAPGMNELFAKDGCLFRVCYHNPSKKRYSAEYLAKIFIERDKETGEEKKKVMLNNGEVLSFEKFEVWRKANFPIAHEAGRNPNNITLGVHSGSGSTKGGM
jgi:hypothetical protein